MARGRSSSGLDPPVGRGFSGAFHGRRPSSLWVLVMTLGVYGVVRMPDTYTRQHAASKMVFLGVITLLLASALPWDKDIVLRVNLIAVFLLLTITRSRRTWSGRLFQGREDARFRVRGYIEP